MATVTLALSGVFAIIAGVLVITNPRLIKWVIGLYLIIIGLLNLIEIGI